MNIVLVEEAEVVGGRAVLSGARARHLIDVLGVKPGDTIRAGIVNGDSGPARVESVAPDRVDLVLEFGEGRDGVMECWSNGCLPNTPILHHSIASLPRIDLLLALPRPKVLKRLWAQLAALGVGRIILTNAAKVERNYFDTHVIDPAFYRPLLIEGLQQARDTRLPEVSVHRRFRPLIEDELDALSDAPLRLVADPGGARRIAEAVAGRDGERILLAVGPEGGWTPFELELLAMHRFEAVSMGPRTLRTDTACIALLGAMMG